MIEICSLFSCDLDMLVRGDVEKDMVEDTAQYDRFYNQFSETAAAARRITPQMVSTFLAALETSGWWRRL